MTLILGKLTRQVHGTDGILMQELPPQQLLQQEMIQMDQD